MTSNKHIDLIDVPLDLGANKHGACLGPQAIRQADLEKKLSSLNVKVSNQQDLIIPNRNSLQAHHQHDHYQSIIQQTCQTLSHKTYHSLQHGHMPISLGGDHSLALGSIAGVKQWHYEQKQSLGVIWFDAHADLNTPTTSTSQNIHGMPLAVLLGHGASELTQIGAESPFLEDQAVSLLGLRALDPPEIKFISQHQLSHYPMTTITTRGIETIMSELIEDFVQKFDAIHISFDIDGIDPHYAPGVSTPVPRGFTVQDVEKALRMLAETNKLTSMDIVELNPIYDIENKTALLATHLIQTALGY